MIEATFSLCDPLNPGIGYRLIITRRTHTLLSTSVAPDDGSELKTAADCVRVINMYLPAPWVERNRALEHNE